MRELLTFRKVQSDDVHIGCGSRDEERDLLIE
jgi:hypothetical protein